MKITTLLFCLLPLPVLLSNCAASRKQRIARNNEQTVRRWFEEGWNHNRNEELLAETFCVDWADGNPLRPNPVDSLEGIRQTVKFYRKAFADAHFTVTHCFATESHVSLRYEVIARQVGESFGIQPTGKTFTSTGIVIYEMEKGKIKRSWQELDLMGITKQLNANSN